MQLDFRAVLDRVSHIGFIYMLQSIGVGGCVLSICCHCLIIGRVLLPSKYSSNI